MPFDLFLPFCLTLHYFLFLGQALLISSISLSLSLCKSRISPVEEREGESQGSLHTYKRPLLFPLSFGVKELKFFIQNKTFPIFLFFTDFIPPSPMTFESCVFFLGCKN